MRNNFQSHCRSNRDAPCCWGIFTCAPREFIFSFNSFITGLPRRVTAAPTSLLLHHWKENLTCRSSLNHANTCHIKSEVKSEKYYSKVAFFCCCCYLQLWMCLINVCRTSITELSLAGVLYGEIKENHEGYLNLSWHSKSEDGVDCSPLIEDTFERCLAVCQMGLRWCGKSWCKRDLQWPGKSCRTTPLSEIDVKYDVELTLRGVMPTSAASTFFAVV